MDDLFNSNIDATENKKLTNSEFVSETRKILSKIDKELQTANTWVRVTEEEYEKQDCDNCKGGCVIVRNGKELNCTPDKNDGDCFVLDFQHEQFVEEIENIMFHSPNYLFYDLLSCELEIELTPETFTINDMYVTSKQLFDCQDELKAYQKELIDLQNENKQLKERIKELDDYLDEAIRKSGSVLESHAYNNVKKFIKNQK